MSIIGYARVSTVEQDLKQQLFALKEAGAVKVFNGKQSGASSENEAKLQQMLEYVREGDTVLVTRLDRLGRSLKSILGTVDAIHEKGAKLQSLDGAIDTSNNNAFAKATISLLGTFAQLERDLIVQRTSEGRAAAKAQGKHLGRTKKLTDKEVSAVRKAFDSGESKSSLSSKYGVSRATIMRIVNRELKSYA